MKTIALPDGTPVPALGQGSWMMAERPERRAGEIAALREGLELGLSKVLLDQPVGQSPLEPASRELALHQRADPLGLPGQVCCAGEQRRANPVAACQPQCAHAEPAQINASPARRPQPQAGSASPRRPKQGLAGRTCRAHPGAPPARRDTKILPVADACPAASLPSVRTRSTTPPKDHASLVGIAAPFSCAGTLLSASNGACRSQSW